jgi:hypothetical protein
VKGFKLLLSKGVDGEIWDILYDVLVDNRANPASRDGLQV